MMTHDARAALPGLMMALAICEQIDEQGRADDCIREPIDCIEAIMERMRAIQDEQEH